MKHPARGVMIVAPDEIRGKETAIPIFPPPRDEPFKNLRKLAWGGG